MNFPTNGILKAAGTKNGGTHLMRASSVVAGFIWNFSEQLLKKGVGAVTTILLSYFLLPEDFGLLSMLALFLALASALMDSGLRDGLMRRKRLSRRLLNTALTASILLGMSGCGLLFTLAPMVAELYQQPVLRELLRTAGLVVLLNALQSVPSARLAVHMDFRALLLSNLPGTLVSSVVALASAWQGLGVWSLVSQMLAHAAISTAFVWRAAGWSPRLSIDRRLIRPLYFFGCRLFLANLVSISVKNLIPAAVGKYLGVIAAGNYYFIDKIMDVVVAQLVYSVQNVAYPALSQIPKATNRLKPAYRKVLIITTALTAPLLMTAAGIARPLFELVFPAPWLHAYQYFQVICFVYLIYPLHAVNVNLLKVRGEPALLLRLEIMKATISLTILALSLPHGLMAVLCGQALSSLLCYAPNSFFAKKMIGYGSLDQISDVLPCWLMGMLAGVVAYLSSSSLEGSALWLQCVSGVCAASAVFVALGMLLKLNSTELIFSVVTTARKNDLWKENS